MEDVTVRGMGVPALGFGTWPLKGNECRLAVEHALEIGYRHLDTAQMYTNEEAVGTAIENAAVDREDVFVVTKVARENLSYEDVLHSVEASLDRLGTAIDVLLIHAPSRTVPIEESIEAMNQLQATRDVRHIGVSNFSVPQMQEAMDASGTPILTNQVEYHPFTSQDDVLEFCIDNDIMLTAYSPVAEGRVTGNQVLEEIGGNYGKTAAQVALRWLIQQENVSAIPKAGSRAHRTENFDIFDFELTGEEMGRIFDLDGGLGSRLRNLLGF